MSRVPGRMSHPSDLPLRLVNKDGGENVLFGDMYWAPSFFLRFDKILDMWVLPMSPLFPRSWFSFILCWGVIFTIDFIIFGIIFTKMGTPPYKDCFENIDCLTAGFLFAFETAQVCIPLCYRVLPLPPAQTIGYGSRSPLPGCPDGILVTILHIFLTTLLATLFSGSFLAKFAK